MFRQRGSGYARQARRRRAWCTWLVALAGCGVVVLAVHFATAPRALSTVSSSYSHAFRAYGGQGSDHGYGRGGYPLMPHPAEAAAATVATAPRTARPAWCPDRAIGRGGSLPRDRGLASLDAWPRPAKRRDDVYLCAHFRFLAYMPIRLPVSGLVVIK